MARTKTPGLTARQEAVLVFITDFIEEHTYCPSIVEIGAGLGMKSTSTVFDHLRALDGKGYIAIHGKRAITVLKTITGRDVAGCRLVA